jgi:hypothetical protein
MLATAGIGRAVPADAAEPSAPAPLSFGWTLPAKATVISDTTKRDRSAKLRYTLTAEPEGGDGKFVVRIRDVVFLELDGRSADTPELKQALAPSLAIASAAPGLIVSAEGLPLGMVARDYDAVIETFSRQARDNPQMQQVLDMLKTSPEMRRAAEANAANAWNTWVGAWVDLDLEEGGAREATDTVDFAGQSVPQRLVFRHLGRTGDCTDCVWLQSEGTLEGPQMKEAMSGMLRTMAQQGGAAESPDAFLDSVEDVRRRIVFEVVTDSKTLRPVRSSSEVELSIRIKNQAPAVQAERTRYAFTWH